MFCPFRQGQAIPKVSREPKSLAHRLLVSDNLSGFQSETKNPRDLDHPKAREVLFDRSGRDTDSPPSGDDVRPDPAGHLPLSQRPRSLHKGSHTRCDASHVRRGAKDNRTGVLHLSAQCGDIIVDAAGTVLYAIVAPVAGPDVVIAQEDCFCFEVVLKLPQHLLKQKGRVSVLAG